MVRLPLDQLRRLRSIPLGYLAGLIAIAFVVFGWSLNVGFPIIAVLMIADFILET